MLEHCRHFWQCQKKRDIRVIKPSFLEVSFAIDEFKRRDEIEGRSSGLEHGKWNYDRPKQKRSWREAKTRERYFKSFLLSLSLRGCRWPPTNDCQNANSLEYDGARKRRFKDLPEKLKAPGIFSHPWALQCVWQYVVAFAITVCPFFGSVCGGQWARCCVSQEWVCVVGLVSEQKCATKRGNSWNPEARRA